MPRCRHGSHVDGRFRSGCDQPIDGSARTSACTTSASNCVPANRQSSCTRLGAGCAPDDRRARSSSRRTRPRRGRCARAAGSRHPQPVRVALAVGPFVVQLDDRQVRREERHGPQDARAGHWMLLDRLEFLRGQRSRLAQHVVADADLADVVEQRAEPQRVEIVGRQPQLRGRRRRRSRSRARNGRPCSGSRASSASAERADRADVRASRLRLRRGRRVAISVLNVSVSASTSRLEPVRGTGRVESPRRRQRRQRARQRVDRARQRARQPQARQPGHARARRAQASASARTVSPRSPSADASIESSA